MGFAEIFGFVYALVKAIPLVEKAVRDFLVFYAIKEKEWYAKEVDAAIKKAIATGETRDLENSIGSPRAGKPSGDVDSDFDDPTK